MTFFVSILYVVLGSNGSLESKKKKKKKKKEKAGGDVRNVAAFFGSR